MTTTADHSPGGFKGMGEAGTIGAASAITAAIENALPDLDLRLTRLPVSPPRLLDAITGAAPTETAEATS
jgi:carbon-monoxide dehydrogenase large subunit